MNVIDMARHKGEANPQIVTLLERMLEEAQNGRLRAIALVTTRANGDMDQHWAGVLSAQMIGALEIAKASMVADMLDQTPGPSFPEPAA